MAGGTALTSGNADGCALGTRRRGPGRTALAAARLQAIASTTGSARTWASAWWLSTTGRWTVCRAASRGAGNRGQTEPARRSGVPPRGYADRLPTTGDRLRDGATVAGATQRLTKPKRRQRGGDEREGELGATRFHGRLNAREAAERAAGAPRGMRPLEGSPSRDAVSAVEVLLAPRPTMRFHRGHQLGEAEPRNPTWMPLAMTATCRVSTSPGHSPRSAVSPPASATRPATPRPMPPAAHALGCPRDHCM